MNSLVLEWGNVLHSHVLLVYVVISFMYMCVEKLCACVGTGNEGRLR